MSRNSNRTAPPVQPPDNEEVVPTPAPNAASQAQNNPFGLSFVVPTEFVDLPSGGRFYDESHPLHGVTRIEIKQMTAKEEDILVNKGYIENGDVFDRLLDSLIVDKGILASDLLSGDKDALLIAARRSGYGDSLQITAICGDCNKKSQFTYDLSKQRIDNSELPEGVTFHPQGGLFEFVLPKSGIKVKIRLLSGIEVSFLEKQKNKKIELNLETNDTVDFLRKTIVEANDVSDRSLLEQLALVLPAIDSRKVRVMHTKLMPSLDTSQTIECSNCSSRIESEVPFDLNFFWPDL